MADAPVFLEIVCFGVEREPGVYEATLPTVAGYLFTIERTGRAGGFHHRTLRTVLFLTRPPGEPAALRALDAPAGDRSRVVSIDGGGAAFRVHVELELSLVHAHRISADARLGHDGPRAVRAAALSIQ